ncbi:MAG: hypothetical protein WA637_04030, partial [Terriglobales bacterium]
VDVSIVEMGQLHCNLKTPPAFPICDFNSSPDRLLFPSCLRGVFVVPSISIPGRINRVSEPHTACHRIPPAPGYCEGITI